MADAQRAVAAAFPPPPPFWKHFTTENIEKLDKLKTESAKSHAQDSKKKWSPSELQALEAPTDLRYLIPPKAPTEGSYSVFGELQSVRVFFMLSLLSGKVSHLNYSFQVLCPL
jgi:mediator of RNA polymerase II transcription subunit 7